MLVLKSSMYARKRAYSGYCKSSNEKHVTVESYLSTMHVYEPSLKALPWTPYAFSR